MKTISSIDDNNSLLRLGEVKGASSPSSLEMKEGALIAKTHSFAHAIHELGQQPMEKEKIDFQATNETPLSDSEFQKGVDELTSKIQQFEGIEPSPTIAEMPSQAKANFVHRIRDLVNQILLQLSRIAERDRLQVDEMKSKYRSSTGLGADLTKKLGDAGFKISAVAFALLLGQFAFPAPTPNHPAYDREIMKFLSKQVPQVGGMYTGRLQSKQRAADSLAQLLLAEYNAKTSKTQSESNSKQEVLQLLQSVLDALKRASSNQ